MACASSGRSKIAICFILDSDDFELGVELCIFCVSCCHYWIFMDCCPGNMHVCIRCGGVVTLSSGSIVGFANLIVGRLCGLSELFNMDFELI